MDHWMFTAALTGAAPTSDALAQRRRPVCDRRLLCHTQRAQVLRETMGMQPSVRWRVHADDHNAIVAIWTRSVLEVIAPLTKARPRKSWLSQEALGSAAQRAAARSALTKTIRRQRVAICTACIDQWHRHSAGYRPRRHWEPPGPQQLRQLDLDIAVAWRSLIQLNHRPADQEGQACSLH